MHFKLIIAFVDDNKTDLVLDTARKNGAKGATVINSARGEGLQQSKTFFGLTLETQRDVLVISGRRTPKPAHSAKQSPGAEFDIKPGTGIGFSG